MDTDFVKVLEVTSVVKGRDIMLGGVGTTQQHWFLMVLKAGKFKIKVLTDLMPSEAYSWFACACLLSVPRPPYVRNEKYRQALSVSSFKGSATIVMPHLYNLIQT